MPEVAAAAIVVGDGWAEMDALVNKQTISCCFNYWYAAENQLDTKRIGTISKAQRYTIK